MRALASSMLVIALALPGCGVGASVEATRAHAPEPYADHECAACGMIVREQLSPRAQVAHRDGTHAWLCSIADAAAYVAAPSPHGRIEQIWVETLASDVDIAAGETAPRPWAEASSAWFVLGVERMGVMGAPVLVFGCEADARAASARLGGRIARWDALMSELGGGGAP